MLPAFEIAYYYWIILCLGFWVLELLKIGKISAVLVVSAAVMALITYLAPGLSWVWQVWGFIMLMALSSIVYLRQLPPVGEKEKEKDEEKDEEKGEQKDEEKGEQKEVTTAADLLGTKVSLTQPLYPGTSKLEVGGRFWNVSANRDFPAGTVVEVVGNTGNTLDIVSSDLPTYGGNGLFPESMPLDSYQREAGIEDEYGEPDFDYWLAFQDALVDHRRVALVYAYHVLSGMKGLSLDEARTKLNTYTLALYDPKREGKFLHLQKQMSSQPRIYGFLYMNGQWTGRDKSKFEEEIKDLIAALHSNWAVKYRGDIDAAKVLRAVMMIRSQQMAEA